jgi:hypothetical protein
MTTTTSQPTSHGSVVRAVAHEHTNCAHGSDVAQVASDGLTHNPGRQTEANHGRCAQASKPTGPQRSPRQNTRTEHRSNQDTQRPNNPPRGQHETNS